MIGPLDFWLEQDLILVPIDRENYSQSNCVFGFLKKYIVMMQNAIEVEIVATSV